jgi:transposase
MQSISTIGLDVAKSVFQVHGVDATGQVTLRRRLKRRHVLAFFQKPPPCWWVSRRAPHRAIGPASCRHWGIRYG